LGDNIVRELVELGGGKLELDLLTSARQVEELRVVAATHRQITREFCVENVPPSWVPAR
jgi:hypothetical protein